MILEIVKVFLLIGGIAALRSYGLLVASSAVGVAFGATCIAGVALVAREGVSITRLIVGFLQPVLACGVMALVVWLVYRGLGMVGIHTPAVQLAAMIVAGA